VRAVRGAEGVVDEQVAAFGEAARGVRVVLGLAGVEARVLEDLHALVGKQLAQALGDRRHRERRVLSLRPPEVRAHGDGRRVALEQQLQRGKRGLDARVVGNPPVLERDVEVGADENVLPRDVRVANRARPPHLTEGACR
jgi:hypothetical protein